MHADQDPLTGTQRTQVLHADPSIPFEVAAAMTHAKAAADDLANLVLDTLPPGAVIEIEVGIRGRIKAVSG